MNRTCIWHDKNITKIAKPKNKGGIKKTTTNPKDNGVLKKITNPKENGV